MSGLEKKSDSCKLVKLNLCGIEYPSKVVWHEWQPNLDHVRYIYLKNKSFCPQKISFTSPSIINFKCNPCNNVLIAPGNLIKIPITFKPTEKTNYTALMNFESDWGQFCVSLQALLTEKSKLTIIFPEKINFEPCAVGAFRCLQFVISNVSEIDTTVQILNINPFTFEPDKFELHGNSCISSVLSFQPKLAKIYEATVSLLFGEDFKEVKTVNITGQALYPKLILCDNLTSFQNQMCLGNSGNVKQKKEFTEINNAKLELNVSNIKVKKEAVINKIKLNISNNFPALMGNEENCKNENFNRNCDKDKFYNNNRADNTSNRQKQIFFGETPVGKTTTKYIYLVNASMVDTCYKLDILNFEKKCTNLYNNDNSCCCCCGIVPGSINNIENDYYQEKCQTSKNEILPSWSSDNDPHELFSIRYKCGIIKSFTALQIPIVFRPNLASLKYKINIIAKASTKDIVISKDTLLCEAESCKAKIRLSKKTIDFGKVPVSKMHCLQFFIMNESACSINYSFEINNCLSWFKIEPYSGKVKGQSSNVIKVYFQAYVAMTYFMKVACIIHNVGVHFVNLMATCLNEDTCSDVVIMDGNQRVDKNPTEINPYHLRKYLSLKFQGLSHLGVAQLSSLFDNGDICLNAYNGLIKIINENLCNNYRINTVVNENDEYFHDELIRDVQFLPHVSLSVEKIDFGVVQPGCPVKKEFFVTNHTRGKIQVTWNSCSPLNEFTIEPCRKVIEEEQSTMFIACFKPIKPNHFYSAQHYSVVHPIPFLSSITTDENVVFPPWSLTISMFAQTFGFGAEKFVPSYKIDPPLFSKNESFYLKMVSTELSRPVYKTICIHNNAQTPMLFEITIDDSNINNYNSSRCITYKPDKGIIQANQSQIIMIKYVAKHDNNINDGCITNFGDSNGLKGRPNGDRDLNYQTNCDENGKETINCIEKTKNMKSFWLNINDDLKYREQVMIEAHLETPRCVLRSLGHVTFRPTCTGCQNSVNDTITNLSCLPLKYRWLVPKTYSKHLSIDFLEGILNPFETKTLKWTFNCEFYEKVIFKVKLRIILVESVLEDSNDNYLDTCCEKNCLTNDLSFIAKCHNEKARNDVEYTTNDLTCINEIDSQKWVERGSEKLEKITLIGYGSRASIESSHQCIDLGPLVLNQQYRDKLTQLHNYYNCDVYYKLHIKEIIFLDSDHVDWRKEIECDGECDDNEKNEMKLVKSNDNGDDLAIELSPMQGKLQSSIKQDLLYCVKLTRRKNHLWIVSYTLHNERGVELEHQPKCYLMKIFSVGVIPVLAFVDAKPSGSSSCISSNHLWSLFSIDELNTRLKQDSEDYTCSRSNEKTLDLNFLPAPIGSQDCVFTFTLKNVGTVNLKWCIVNPTDLNVKVENWAESSEVTCKDLQQMQVVGNQLFKISQTKGFLNVGCCCFVSFTFRHILIGSNQIPLLFKIECGNQVKINLKGLTVPQNSPFLCFFKKEFQLSSTFIGLKSSPIQYIDAYNGGDVKVNFNIDISKLCFLNQINYNHNIFECLNTCGSIDPGQVFQIGIKFCPIEAKLYMVELPICVDGKFSEVINIKGVGKNTMQSSSLTSSSSSTSTVNSSNNCDFRDGLNNGSMCLLSRNKINFGDVPINCRVKMMTSLMNSSDHLSFKFKWFVKNPEHSDVVHVEPSEGCLKFNQSLAIKITLNTQSSPQFLQLDLLCETMSLSDINKYNKDLQAYIKKREDMRNEIDFEFVDSKNDDLDAIQNTEIEVSACGDYLSKPVELLNYCTLPPIIKPQSVVEQRECIGDNLKNAKNFFKRPNSPSKNLLQLTVQAVSHGLEEFETTFKNLKNKFFIDRSYVTSSFSETNSDNVCNDFDKTEELCNPCDEFITNVTNLPITNFGDNMNYNINNNNNNDNIDNMKNIVTNFNAESLGDGNNDIEFDGEMIKNSSNTNECITVHNSNSSQSINIASNVNTCKMMRNFFSSIIKDVIEDESFYKSWMQLSQEPIPYFKQFTRAESKSPNTTNCFKSKQGHRVLKEILSKKRECYDSASNNAKSNDDLNNLITESNKRSKHYQTICEDVLENSIYNILMEAFYGQFNITARPRLVALPPRSNTGNNNFN